MSTTVRWDEFDKLHVIRKLRELVGKWWNIQINFTDHKGFLRGVPEGKFFNPINPVCKFVTSQDKGFVGCVETSRKTTVQSMSIKKTQISRCHAGFSTLSVPIRIGEQYLGCVFGDGFVLEESAAEQRSLILNYLERTFPNDLDRVNKMIAQIPALSSRDLDYLKELIELVVEEIILVNRDLSSANKKVEKIKAELGERFSFDQMIGKSNIMQNLYRMVERVCKSDATVLVQGENGSGKELIARSLHYNSGRKGKKFVVINCGAFNENLLESELFGHAKGSFTGAIKDKKGLFEEADQGTLFLDEIGETSPAMQVKLLRVLQDQTFKPVGSNDMRKVDVRVLAATNRDLSQMVKDGTFREDLFYRLNVITMTVPPLRDRPEDILMLIDHFLDKYARTANGEKKSLSKDCLQRLLNHSWPGNVRELENEIERICVLAGSDKEIISEFLSPRITNASSNEAKGSSQSFTLNTTNLKDAIEDLEKSLISEGLQRTRFNKSKLAKELGISRAGLIMKVEKYGLEKRN